MIDHRYDHPGKVYVDVYARHLKEGRRVCGRVMYVEPVAFVWEDGARYKIESVTDMRRAASLKAGGVGMRYTVTVRGKETYMFLEEDRWFMERALPQ